MAKWMKGRVVVALILLLGAAFSVYTTCRKLPPLSLAILSERLILEAADSSISGGQGEMALSPTGRHVLFVRSETTVFQPFLLDVETGKETRLPISPLQPRQLLSAWMDGPFTPNGHRLHELEPLAADLSVSDGMHVYDIRNATSRKISVGKISAMSNDESGEYVWVTVQKQKDFIFFDGDHKDVAFQVTRVSLSSGSVTPYPVNGMIWGSSRADRAIVFNWPGKPGRPAAPDLSIMDLSRGKTLKTLPVGELWHIAYSPAPFRTADDRFLCFGDGVMERNLLAAARNWLSSRWPSITPSDSPENRDVRLSCFWDSAKDRVVTLRDCAAFAPGPSESSVIILDSESSRLRVRDLATGQEYTPQTHADDPVVCAHGKYVVYKIADSKGGEKFVLVEIALPATASSTTETRRHGESVLGYVIRRLSASVSLW